MYSIIYLYHCGLKGLYTLGYIPIIPCFATEIILVLAIETLPVNSAGLLSNLKLFSTQLSFYTMRFKSIKET